MVEYRPDTPSDISDRGKRLLLIVDSDANSRFYTSTILKRFNYNISTAKTAQEAIDLAKQTAPSLIIAAQGLKDMDGLELIRHFKNDPGMADVPIIVLRKRGDLGGERRCLELGAVDCLYQPIDAETLYRVVQDAVEKKPRTHMRVRTLQPVKVNNVLPESFENACVLDLSERGMFLQSSKPAAVNARLSLQIDLNHTIIPVEAVVVYSYKTAGRSYLQARMGLEFVRIEVIDQEYIRQFIRNEVMRGILPGNA